MRFLSERNIEMHREYLNTLMLKYSIFEKSYPALVGCDVSEICKLGIKSSEREAAIRLYSEIVLHKLYFSSFSERNLFSMRIKNQYGSVASFLYQVREECKNADTGFLLVYDGGKDISFDVATHYRKICWSKNPILALDLCEHAYFYDYGFDRERYVLEAISHFDLSKIEKSAN